jgi:hypothetical protein
VNRVYEIFNANLMGSYILFLSLTTKPNKGLAIEKAGRFDGKINIVEDTISCISRGRQ